MSALAQHPPARQLERKPMVRRQLIGGPWDGRHITIPEADLTLACNWLSGHYCLDAEGNMEFLQHTSGCERPYGIPCS